MESGRIRATALNNQVMVDEVMCETAEEFVEELLPTRTSRLRAEYQYCERRHWFFRGQADAEWSLEPKAFREIRYMHAGELVSIPEIRRLVPGQVKDVMPKPLSLARQELEWVIEFCQQLHDIGLPIPDNSPELRSLDPSAIELHNFPPAVYRAAFALAQHYGLPTRLLDWTTKPLVAAYFAAVEVARERCERGVNAPSKERLAVWALNVAHARWFHHQDPGFEFLSAPSSSNPNLHAQAGMFTLVRFGANNERAQQEHPPAIDALIESTPVTLLPEVLLAELPALVKVVLPCTEARALLRLLSEYKVSAAQVYPGHKGAADALYERRWWQWARPKDRC